VSGSGGALTESVEVGKRSSGEVAERVMCVVRCCVR